MCTVDTRDVHSSRDQLSDQRVVLRCLFVEGHHDPRDSIARPLAKERVRVRIQRLATLLKADNSFTNSLRSTREHGVGRDD